MSAAAAPLVDAEARLRIREDLDATLIVEAAAGTGKTTTLIDRVVELVRRGRATLDRVVAVTFTDKAAGEMKLRLRERIEAARRTSADPTDAAAARERGRLDDAIRQLETARISTIHALCADLLRERPIEAAVDPRFEVGAEGQAERIFEQVFSGWYRAAVEDQERLPGVRRVLRRARSQADDGPRETLRSAAADVVERRDYPAPWAAPDYDRAAAVAEVVTDARLVARLVERAGVTRDPLATSLAPVVEFVRERDRWVAARGPDAAVDLDGDEASLRALHARLRWAGEKVGRGKWFARELERTTVIAARDVFLARLDAFIETTDADVAAALHAELQPVARRYQELKEKAGVLDFLDLLLRTRRLLVEDRDVRAELQERFDRVLIDEFQDTNPLQAEILLLLTADTPDEADWRRVRPTPGKLFVVGDPKQSIYRFRRADVALYEAIKERLVARGAEVLHLRSCFRLAPSLAHAVNAAFAPAMQTTPNHTQTAYVALEPVRSERAEQPTLVALPAPSPFSSWGRVTQGAVADSYPAAVGGFVAWLVGESGWTVEERRPDGELARVPIAPRHVCLLFKRMRQSRGPLEAQDVTRAYTRELEKRGVPHVLVGGHSFFTRPEVLALRNALTAVEWPDDELAAYATLKGPLFGLNDDALLVYRHARGRLAPLAALAAASASGPAPDDPDGAAGAFGAAADPRVGEVAAALAILGGLHRARNRRPLADTVTALLDRTRAHAGLAFWPAGEQALANALRVIELARRFEAAGASSFRAFVAHLDGLAERGDAAETPAIEEDTEGVRLMTVHKAKGLEFHVVILCDPSASAAPWKPREHVDVDRGLWAFQIAGCVPREVAEHAELAIERDREETVRLAYVAATRARDLLVVPVVADGPLPGRWIDVLTPVVYPAASTALAPALAPGCPAFGAEAVVERPERALEGAASAVRPGQHAPRAGDAPVVWWDPNVLGVDLAAPDERSRHRLLQASDAAPARAAVDAHARWSEKRDRVATAAAAPTRPAAGFGALVDARPELNGSAPVTRVEVPGGDARRPRSPRFGTLVHLALADAPLGGAPTAERVRPWVSLHAALIGAPPAEVEAAVEVVVRTLGTDVMQRASASADCRRETPVALALADGTVGEGVVDLAFSERGEDGVISWVVVDYKTGRDEAREALDTRRLALYCDAVAAATGAPTRGVLLVV